MEHIVITKTAIDLLYMPSRVRLLRSAPLPRGVLILFQIVAGDEVATTQASEATGRSCETVRAAAAFFIEQVLLYPEADSYRVLGAEPDASNSELRRNMSLLLRWLHPDRDSQDARSVFAGRVTRAWNDVKSEDRRAAYDRSRSMALVEKSLARKKSPKMNNHWLAQYPNALPHGLHRSVRTFKSRSNKIGFFRWLFLLLLWKIGP